MPMGMKIDNGIAVALFSTVYNSQTKIKPGLKHPLRRHQNIWRFLIINLRPYILYEAYYKPDFMISS